jgi:acyl-CoA reductase-like NAD-dependent aldehyde dehydrogenase
MPVSPPPFLQSFVAGAFRPADTERTIASVNPSDPEDVVGHVPAGTAAEAAAAVAAAAEAGPAWRRSTGVARAEVLYRWAGVIAERAEELAQAMAREVGKPIGEARGEAARAVAILRYYAGEAVRQIGEVIPSQLPDTLQLTLREPLGVVALITPWNFPVAIPLWKAAPALAFGNTVALKPSEASSGVAALLAETAAAAGLPAGIFNVVLGEGATVAEALLDHPEVRGVSFTGSARVGARVAELAARRNLRYQTEMGGKNAAIVAADADLAKAAALTAAGAMRYAGQKCTATSRVIVDRKVWEAFLPLLVAEVEALALGPVTDPAAAVGPLIAERPRRRILDLLAAEPCRVHTGGGAPEDPRFAAGWFLRPTVVSEVAAGSPYLQDELFGPLLTAVPADDLDHAVALANDSAYGLSAALFTRDTASALAYVQRIEAGLVRVNGDTTGVDPHAPFGGVKGSSSGSREQGPAARDFYTEIKTVQIGRG